MEITKDNVNELAEELRRYIGANMPEDTSSEVMVCEDVRPCIEVEPGEKNKTTAFFHGVEIVDFCRGRRLSFWIGAREKNGKLYPYIHIY